MPAKRKRKPNVRKTTKGKNRNFRSTKEGAGMTKKGVAAYRRKNPGSKLKTGGRRKYNMAKQQVRVKGKPAQKKEKSDSKKCKAGSVYDAKVKKCVFKAGPRKKNETLMEFQFRNQQSKKGIS